MASVPPGMARPSSIARTSACSVASVRPRSGLPASEPRSGRGEQRAALRQRAALDIGAADLTQERREVASFHPHVGRGEYTEVLLRPGRPCTRRTGPSCRMTATGPLSRGGRPGRRPRSRAARTAGSRPGSRRPRSRANRQAATGRRRTARSRDGPIVTIDAGPPRTQRIGGILGDRYTRRR